MFILEVHDEHSRRVLEWNDDALVVVGRGSHCGIVMADEFVSLEQARLYRNGGAVWIQTMGLSAVWLDDVRIPPGDAVEIPHGSVVRIRSLKIRVIEEGGDSEQPTGGILARFNSLESELYLATFGGLDFRSLSLLPDTKTREACDTIRPSFDNAFHQQESALLTDAHLKLFIMSRILLRATILAITPIQSRSSANQDVELPISSLTTHPTIVRVVQRILKTLAEAHAKRAAAGKRESKEQLLIANWTRFQATLLDGIPSDMCEALIREEMFRRIVNLTLGLGPLEDLLENPAANEVLIVGAKRIYVEVGGVLRLTGETFPSDESTRRILERAVARQGRRIDISTPYVDAQLPDGSRLNAVISPLSRSGDVLTIRKFRPIPFSLDSFEEQGLLTPVLKQFLVALVRGRRNIVIAGGTGSGKTTLLTALAAESKSSDRMLILEDTAEIRLPDHMHAVYLQTRQANLEGAGAIPMQVLLRNALRMRPDRLVVGECRGAEVLEMLQAMNTGHPGSFTTLHANTLQEVVSRIETMVLQGIDMPLLAIRQQIASAVDIIVHVGRVHGGGRRILGIAEVAGYDARENRVMVQPIFVWDAKDARYRFCGWIPTFVEQLEQHSDFRIGDLLD